MSDRSRLVRFALTLALPALFALGCAGEATTPDSSSAPCDDGAPLDTADADDGGSDAEDASTDDASSDAEDASTNDASSDATDDAADAGPGGSCAGQPAGAPCGSGGLCDVGGSCACPAGTVWNAANAACEACTCDVAGVAVALPVAVTNVYYPADAQPQPYLAGGTFRSGAALAGGRLAIPNAGLTSAHGAGGVAIHSRDAAGAWSHETTLLRPADALPAHELHFANVVALAPDGQALATYSASGAPLGGSTTSAVRVYQRGAPGVWVSSPPMPLPPNANGSGMDSVVAEGLELDDDWLIVGAPNRTLQQEWGRGSAFFYGRDAAGTWALRQTMHGTGNSTRFGASVDLQGGEVVIGSPGQGGPGAVQIHRLAAGQWSTHQTIPAPLVGATQARDFGVGVGRSGDRLVVVGVDMTPLGAGAFCIQSAIYVYDRPAGGNFALTGTISDALAPSCGGITFGTDLRFLGDGVLARGLVGSRFGDVRLYAWQGGAPTMRWRLPIATPPGLGAPGQLDPAQPGSLADGMSVLTDGTSIAADARGILGAELAVRVYALGAGACTEEGVCDCAPGYAGPDCGTLGCATAADCDDANPCTADTCTATVCGHAPIATSTACDDGNACTSGDACSEGTCMPGTAISCDDGDACNKDLCLPASGCFHISSLSTACDDGDACTSGDTCNKKTGCSGVAIACDDANACTVDACDPATGCSHVALPTGATCTDGNACTGPDACTSGVCVPGALVACDDGSPCTADSCDAINGCVHTPSVGDFCGGAGLCVADGSCDCPAGTVWNAATATCEGCACDVDGVAVALPVAVTNVYRDPPPVSGLVTWGEQASLRAGRLAICDPLLPTAAGTGGVQLYQRDASGVWSHEATLTPPANRLPQENAFAFRAVLAAGGNRAVVYSRELGPNYGYGASALRVYDRGGPGVWTSGAPVAMPPPAFPYDGDGLHPQGLVADGDWLMVGAPQRRQLSSDMARGAVYILHRDPQGAWSITQTLWGVDLNGKTGVAVDLQGDEAIIGSPGTAPGSSSIHDTFGRVDVLVRSGTTWSIAQTLTGQPGTNGQKTGFGWSVARAGNTLYVGAIKSDGCGFNGSVRAFRRTASGASFAPVAHVFETSPSCQQEWEFGREIEAFDGGVLVRSRDNVGRSSLRLFDVGATGFSRRWRLPLAAPPGAGQPGQFAPWAPSDPVVWGSALSVDGDAFSVGVHTNPLAADAVRVYELGAGACNPQGLCDCEPGYGGPDCSLQICTSATSCDDGNPCTTDACSGAAGQQQCTHTPLSGTAASPVACSDGDACTTGDGCIAGTCVPGPATNCDDGDACTVDACLPASGCSHAFDANAPCSDGLACTSGDHCAAGQGCVGTPVSCDDGNVCTADACKEPATAGKPHGCVHTIANNYAPCNDGDACNVGEVCKHGICMGGTALLCDDGDACTTDACDPASGCGFTPTSGPGCGVLAACDPSGSVAMMQEVTTLLDPGPAGVGFWKDVPNSVLLRGDWLFRGWSAPGTAPAVERVTIHHRVGGLWTEVQQLTPPTGGVQTPSLSRFGDALAASDDGALLIVADGPRRRLLTAVRDANGVYAWQPSQHIANPLGLQNPVLNAVGRHGLAFDGTTLVLTAEFDGARMFRRVGSAWVAEAGSNAGAPSAVSLAFVGRAAALDGNAVLLGNPVNMPTGAGVPTGGLVARYVRSSGGVWAYAGLFGHPTPSVAIAFGHALARSGDRLAVGVPQAGCATTGGAFGRVSMYVRDAANPAGWQHHHDVTLDATIGCAGGAAKLGAALAFDGDVLYAGAPNRGAPNVPGALGLVVRLSVASDASTTLLQVIQPSAVLPPISYAAGTTSDQERFGSALSASAGRLAAWLPMATSDSRPSRTVLLEPMPGTADAAGNCLCLPGFSGPTCNIQACTKASVCDDGNPCTADSCEIAKGQASGTCVYGLPSLKFVPCDDGDACTQVDFCKLGSCAGTEPKDCNDGQFCTDDQCDSKTGACVSVKVPNCKG